ncbi:hypothetical protein ANCCEY_03247 [Ancylostoma ceylanicum]|uniref:Uncharacterized protein n=1 Tax=Ancylostoma ceylanicum TaxID=53326 RepID=A0A0D6M5G8_9BILA|nr:hypothetical protein ANCCEY_03247 [Ancylostoma ceylanicum]
MIRFDPDEDEDMSEEKRFYYLRLMAKPGRKPIKTKFVTWSPEQQSSSRDDDPVLEVQPLADLRAGSLPPKDSRERRFKDDGAKTEPESNNEDTTDYSSSDQYEKSSTVMKSSLPAHYNVLMANPLADITVPPSISETRDQPRGERDVRGLRGGEQMVMNGSGLPLATLRMPSIRSNPLELSRTLQR